MRLTGGEFGFGEVDAITNGDVFRVPATAPFLSSDQ